MKKLSVIVILVASMVFTVEAQEGPMKRKPNFSPAQKAEMAIKKMTLALDLTAKQQKEIAPLLATQINEREAAMKQRMEARKSEKRPTKDEIFEMESKRLDNQIAFKNKMKSILDKEQFQKFEKMAHARKREMRGKRKERFEQGRKKRMMKRWLDEKE